MNKINFTSDALAALKHDITGPRSQRVWINNFPGLGVSLGKNKLSIIHRYKSPITNKFRINKLWSAPYGYDFSEQILNKLKKAHNVAEGQLLDGIDPLEVKAEANVLVKEEKAAEAQEVAVVKAEKERHSYTLDKAFNSYTDNRIFTKDIAESSQVVYIDCYNRNIKPALGHLPIAEIRPAMVYKFLDSIKSNSAHNLCDVVLRRIQRVALREERIEVPFVLETDTRHLEPRKRIIEDLPVFLDFLNNNDQYKSYKNAMHAQLLYGSRAGEIYGLRWDEIDYDNGVISIPWTRVKTRRVVKHQTEPLQLPLMPKMLELLEQMECFSDTYVFPMLNKDIPTHFSIIRYLLKKNGFNLSSHDIRRTVTGTLEDMADVSSEQVDIIADHAIRGVNKSYFTRKNLLQRKRDILIIWHNYLEQMDGSNVTPITAAVG